MRKLINEAIKECPNPAHFDFLVFFIWPPQCDAEVVATPVWATHLAWRFADFVVGL